MPTVEFRGKRIECERGAVLRDVLLDAGETPHNGRTRKLNCGGNGVCGTCAVRVEGGASEIRQREKLRLLSPPHHPNRGLRLACRLRVMDDVRVEKYPGYWGQHADRDPIGAGGEEEPQMEAVDEPTTETTGATEESPKVDRPDPAEEAPETDQPREDQISGERHSSEFEAEPTHQADEDE